MVDEPLQQGLLPMHQGLDWYVNSWFSNYTEVHSAELGVFAGLLVGVLLALGFRRIGAAVLIGLYAFAFGLLDSVLNILDPAGPFGSRVVRLKPWYFLVSLLVILGIFVVCRRVLLERRRSTENTSVLTPFDDRH